MRTCRYTGLDCTQPHLKCKACEVMREAREADKDLLVPERPSPPNARPYVRVVRKKGIALEVGFKGTF